MTSITNSQQLTQIKDGWSALVTNNLTNPPLVIVVSPFTAQIIYLLTLISSIGPSVRPI